MSIDDAKPHEWDVAYKKLPYGWMEARVTRREDKNADMVNHPPHYNQGKVEVIDVIEDLPHWQANPVKYILRAPHKGDMLTDLKKARWHLDRQIKRIESGEYRCGQTKI